MAVAEENLRDPLCFPSSLTLVDFALDFISSFPIGLLGISTSQNKAARKELFQSLSCLIPRF
ncbi:hypothetical protein B5807_07844 [Epicoccum nigrum]|uniref:Uncharacterized protein n=1 Tax=Epicoccum nigrum TaxID=105696 RepID=A0A1Y2LYH1_EPING|nr:hypothetical protein B5807_07844 [Epicoccum nigrum]